MTGVLTGIFMKPYFKDVTAMLCTVVQLAQNLHIDKTPAVSW